MSDNKKLIVKAETLFENSTFHPTVGDEVDQYLQKLPANTSAEKEHKLREFYFIVGYILGVEAKSAVGEN